MYVMPTHDQQRAFFQSGLQGPIDMLTLLRFREVADYSATPSLAPPSPISGREAFQRYAEFAMPFLRARGSELIYAGSGSAPLIGPSDETWDWVMLVRHPDVATFLGFASDEAYRGGLGHRAAALLDSRLIPFQPIQIG